MKIYPNKRTSVSGVPDYYSIYQKWYAHYRETGEVRSKTMAFHYARVAEEMGQVSIDEGETGETRPYLTFPSPEEYEELEEK